MENSQTSRTFRVSYDGYCGDMEEYITTDRREANDIAKRNLGLVEELINDNWVWLGKYDYADPLRDSYEGKELKDFERKWIDSNDIPDVYTDENNVVHSVYKKRH